MFGDDLELFRNLLERLVRNFADLALPLTRLPEDPESVAVLRGRAHKLKGSSGMIGAANVSRLAGALEEALNENPAATGVRESAARLAAALTTLGREARVYLQDLGPPVATAPPAAERGARIGTEDLAELCRLLDMHDLSAMEKFAALSPSLRQGFAPAAFDRLARFVEELEFGRAAQFLRSLEQSGR